MRNRAFMRSVTKLLLVTGAGLLALGLLASGASAQIGLVNTGASLRESAFTLDTSGVLRQAGAHPDFTTMVEIEETAEVPYESARDIEFDLPPGLVADPTAVPQCAFKEFYVFGGSFAGCPRESQVGRTRIGLDVSTGIEHLDRAVYNLTPPGDAPALLGFEVEGVVVLITPRIRPADHGVSAGSFVIGQGLRLISAEVELWGVPGDPSHDGSREGTGSAPPLRPYITSPVSCPGLPASFKVRADSWLHPGAFTETSFDKDLEGTPFLFEGCENVPFAPSMSAQPTTRAASAPTGLDVDLTVPQNEAPYGVASSDVRTTKVTFPKGMAVSPASASGLGGCSPAQIGLLTNDPPSCPESAKIGTVAVKSPLLEEELHGDVILAKQKDNPFGSLLAMYLAIKGPGFYLKLPGKVEADPSTGQLTATFSDTPQLPFEELHLSLKSGPRAPLVTPSTCGTYATTAQISPWSGTAPISSSSSFTIDQGCERAAQFTPAIAAGPTDPIAGRHSPFVFRVTREEGQQNISRIEATLPEGQLAKLAGVALCPDAQAATGSCPAASQVGTTTVAAGEGAQPLYVPQPGKAPTAVYLAGPYKGAPYSLVVKVPAQAGPFDLGTVTVRNALNVDPLSAQVTATSDPLPQILEGIPLAYRTIYLDLDREDFTLNPTSCDPMKVDSTITSAQGASAHPSSRLQVTNCAALGFAPQLSLKVSGGTRRNSYPALKATLVAKKGQANIGRVSATLPHSEFLAQNHIKTICTRVQFAAGNCPRGSIYGYATAVTPLLDKPLSGPVYLRSSNNPLPDLVASLHGAIDIDLSGRIDSVDGGIRATFDSVPDAPVSKFVLSMQGGKKGLLVNSRNLCAAVNRAKVLIDGQNGKTADQGPVVQNSCGARAKRKAPKH
jgi:hypothetical protein